MKILPQKEVATIIEEFLNDNSLWTMFVEQMEEKGYNIEELGFTPEED